MAFILTCTATTCHGTGLGIFQPLDTYGSGTCTFLLNVLLQCELTGNGK